MQKKEVCDNINMINAMIDFMIYDGNTAHLGHEGKMLRNGAILVLREEHYCPRYIDAETVVNDYIDHLFGKDKGYVNLFGMGGKYGYFINYKIYDKNEIIVYDVQVNVEPDLIYMSPNSKMKPSEIDLNSEWYHILYEEYCKEKEKRTEKTLKIK